MEKYKWFTEIIQRLSNSKTIQANGTHTLHVLKMVLWSKKTMKIFRKLSKENELKRKVKCVWVLFKGDAYAMQFWDCETLGDCLKRFGMKRSSVSSYWFEYED